MYLKVKNASLSSVHIFIIVHLYNMTDTVLMRKGETDTVLMMKGETDTVLMRKGKIDTV